VAVEKGTKAVISVNFSAYGKRRFNNLRANFVREIPRKEFFNSHKRSHKLRIVGAKAMLARRCRLTAQSSRPLSFVSGHRVQPREEFSVGADVCELIVC
jgi:hypothetical protein